MNDEALAKAQNKLSHIDTELLTAGFNKEYIDQAILNLPKLWLDLTPEFRRGFQNLVFPEGVFYEKGIGFWNPKLSSIYKLSSDLAHESANKVDLIVKNWNEIMEEIKEFAELARCFRDYQQLPDL